MLRRPRPLRALPGSARVPVRSWRCSPQDRVPFHSLLAGGMLPIACKGRGFSRHRNRHYPIQSNTVTCHIEMDSALPEWAPAASAGSDFACPWPREFSHNLSDCLSPIPLPNEAVWPRGLAAGSGELPVWSPRKAVHEVARGFCSTNHVTSRPRRPAERYLRCTERGCECCTGRVRPHSVTPHRNRWPLPISSQWVPAAEFVTHPGDRPFDPFGEGDEPTPTESSTANANARTLGVYGSTLHRNVVLTTSLPIGLESPVPARFQWQSRGHLPSCCWECRFRHARTTFGSQGETGDRRKAFPAVGALHTNIGFRCCPADAL